MTCPVLGTMLHTSRVLLLGILAKNESTKQVKHISTLQVSKLRCGKVKEFGQGLRAGRLWFYVASVMGVPLHACRPPRYSLRLP